MPQYLVLRRPRNQTHWNQLFVGDGNNEAGHRHRVGDVEEDILASPISATWTAGDLDDLLEKIAPFAQENGLENNDEVIIFLIGVNHAEFLWKGLWSVPEPPEPFLKQTLGASNLDPVSAAAHGVIK